MTHVAHANHIQSIQTNQVTNRTFSNQSAKTNSNQPIRMHGLTTANQTPENKWITRSMERCHNILANFEVYFWHQFLCLMRIPENQLQFQRAFPHNYWNNLYFHTVIDIILGEQSKPSLFSSKQFHYKFDVNFIKYIHWMLWCTSSMMFLAEVY